MDNQARDNFIIQNIYRFKEMYKTSAISCLIFSLICLLFTAIDSYRLFGFSVFVGLFAMAALQYRYYKRYKLAIVNVEACNYTWKEDAYIMNECDTSAKKTRTMLIVLVIIEVFCLASAVLVLLSINFKHIDILLGIDVLLFGLVAYLMTSIILYAQVLRAATALEAIEKEQHND